METTEDEATARLKLEEAGFDPDDPVSAVNPPNERKPQGVGCWISITPMTHFCFYGDLPMCQYILKHGGATTKAGAEWWFPMYAAVNRGHLDICKWLFENGAQNDIRAHTGNAPGGYRPLQNCWRQPRETFAPILKWLLINGAAGNRSFDIDKKNLRRDLAPQWKQGECSYRHARSRGKGGRYSGCNWVDVRPELLHWSHDVLEAHSGFQMFLIGTQISDKANNTQLDASKKEIGGRDDKKEASGSTRLPPSPSLVDAPNHESCGAGAPMCAWFDDWMAFQRSELKNSPCHSKRYARATGFGTMESMRVMQYSKAKLACDDRGTLVVVYGFERLGASGRLEHRIEYFSATPTNRAQLWRLKEAFCAGILNASTWSLTPHRTCPYRSCKDFSSHCKEALDRLGIPSAAPGTDLLGHSLSTANNQQCPVSLIGGHFGVLRCIADFVGVLRNAKELQFHEELAADLSVLLAELPKDMLKRRCACSGQCHEKAFRHWQATSPDKQPSPPNPTSKDRKVAGRASGSA